VHEIDPKKKAWLDDSGKGELGLSYQKTKLGYVLQIRGDTFTRALDYRERLGLNSILLIQGPRGVGKSYMSMKISEERSKKRGIEFTVADVVFNLEAS